MTHFHLDFETRSRADIKEVGAYRYAADPSTSILMFAISRNDEPPVLWDRDYYRGGDAAMKLFTELHNDPTAVAVAHNAGFERAIEKYLVHKTFGLKPLAIEQWRCTAAMCRRAAIPFSLDGASQFLNLTQKKDKAGSVLIKLFSCIQTSGPYKGQFLPTSGSHKVTVNGTKMTIDEAWHMFGEYCLQDVRTEQAIAKALKAVELKGDVLDAFHFDMRMNERGVPINVEGVKRAMELVEEYNVPKAEEFRKLTGLNPTQRDAVFQWLKERGYPYQDVTAATVEQALANPKVSDEVRNVLLMRQELSFAAIKKLPSMLETVCPEDNRIRGSLLWSGALRTHRWSGRLIQPQNMRKPSFKGSERAYHDICAGHSADHLETMYAPLLEVIASCIRNFIHDSENQMLDADYSGIEARILAWICCQWDLLEAFKQGRDTYREMAAKIYNVPLEAVTKDQRSLGKQAVLSGGFGVGADAFKNACAGYNIHISLELSGDTIKAYREANDQIVAAWWAMGSSAVQAVKTPGTRVQVQGLAAPVSFCYHLDVLPFPALTMKLPSGHVLVYPKPELHTIYKIKQYSKTEKDKYTWVTISESYAYEGGSKYPGGDWDDDDLKHSGKLKDGVWKTEELSYYGQLPMSQQWGQVRTFGPRLIENCVQAMAGDFMTHGALNAEKEGYEIFMLVHDQALAPYLPHKGNTKEGFAAALCKLPPWATGFPLEATSDIVDFYLKED